MSRGFLLFPCKGEAGYVLRLEFPKVRQRDFSLFTIHYSLFTKDYELCIVNYELI